jgi:hypothetical protein
MNNYNDNNDDSDSNISTYVKKKYNSHHFYVSRHNGSLVSLSTGIQISLCFPSSIVALRMLASLTQIVELTRVQCLRVQILIVIPKLPNMILICVCKPGQFRVFRCEEHLYKRLRRSVRPLVRPPRCAITWKTKSFFTSYVAIASRRGGGRGN